MPVSCVTPVSLRLGEVSLQFTKLQVPLSNVKLDGEQYQARINDNLPRRAHKLAQSVLDTGALKFNDPLLVYKTSKNEYNVLDGYGRYTAAKELGWKTVNILCLVNPTEAKIRHIVQTCNCLGEVKTPLDKKGMYKIAFECKKAKESNKSIGSKLKLSPNTVPRYAAKGEQQQKILEQNSNILAPGVLFDNATAAKEKTALFLAGICGCTECLKGKTPGAQWKIVQKLVSEQYGVNIISTLACDDQLKSQAYEYLTTDNYRLIAFMYSVRDDVSELASLPICQTYLQIYPGRFLAVKMNTKIAQMNGELVAAFLRGED
jgi:hypothetical protein